jgi:tRNA 2-thiocytidine biosynthesis protein TtcA
VDCRKEMNPLMPITEQQRYSQTKLAKRLQRNTGRAISDYNMISDKDRVMVCLSGGKDSYTLLDMLLALQKRAPVHFELIAVNLDQKQPGFPEHVLPGYLDQLGVPFHVIEQDTYSVVKRVIPDGKTTCGLCSRLRRGALYNFASEHGITRIALGHHRDDIIETLFLNLFNGGRIKAMPPKLLSDDGMMLANWKEKHPGRIENIARAISHVSPSQLADPELFDFVNLGKELKTPAEPPGWLMPVDGIQLDTSTP